MVAVTKKHQTDRVGIAILCGSEKGFQGHWKPLERDGYLPEVAVQVVLRFHWSRCPARIVVGDSPALMPISDDAYRVVVAIIAHVQRDDRPTRSLEADTWKITDVFPEPTEVEYAAITELVSHEVLEQFDKANYAIVAEKMAEFICRYRTQERIPHV